MGPRNERGGGFNPNSNRAQFGKWLVDNNRVHDGEPKKKPAPPPRLVLAQPTQLTSEEKRVGFLNYLIKHKKIRS